MSVPAFCSRRRCRNFLTAQNPSTILSAPPKNWAQPSRPATSLLPDGQVPDIGSMSGPASVAFNLKPGEISGPLNNGADGAVLQVLESQQPTDADFAAKRDQIRDSLLQAKQQQRFGLFVTNIVDQMTKSGKIKRNDEELNQLTRSGSESGM